MRTAIICTLLAVLQSNTLVIHHTPADKDNDDYGPGKSGAILCPDGCSCDAKTNKPVDCLIDVPAVWKTDERALLHDCKPVEGTQNVVQCAPGPKYPTCADENRALLVSVNGKKAVCHLLEEK